MAIRTCIARVFCVIVTAGVAGASDPARAGETGFRERLSKGHARIWRAFEHVVAASHPSGEPRSPTLRTLWEWARTSPHVQPR